MASIHFNLSEDIEKELKDFYQNLCDDLTGELNKMGEKLSEMCDKTQYLPMVEVVNSTIDLLEGEVKNVADQAFDEWEGGEGSFTKAAEMSEAGDQANQTATDLQHALRDIYDSFWSSHPLGDAITIDTSHPKVMDEDFDELKEVYTKHADAVREISENTVNELESMSDDDPTYSLIIPPVVALTKSVNNAFEEFMNKVEKAKGDSEQKVAEQQASNESAKESAIQTSATASEVAQALDMFKDI